jgi:uracil phosphoribosyltransferase
MKVHVANHPLINHKLTVLRDERTDSPTFRRLVEELVTLLAYEATRDVRTHAVEITTPVTKTVGQKLAEPRPVVVPILRAGLGMLEGMSKLIPTAEVGFLGMVRDEKTLEASTYANRLPDDLSGRQVFVLDPMLATGGTLIMAFHYLIDLGATDITAVCILSAPEGIAAVEKEFANSKVPITIVTGALEGDDTVPQKVKRGVEECDKQNDYVVFAADDVQFSPNDFIQAYLQLNKGDGYFLCAFNTGIKECEHFMFILEGLDFLSNGEIFDTRFHHVGCDNWLWEQMDELSFATRAHLTNTKHNHFSRGGQMDAVYEKGWDKTQQDRDLLQALKETFKP